MKRISFFGDSSKMSCRSGFPNGSACKESALEMQESQETQVLLLGWEYPLGEGMVTCSRIPAWRVPWTEEPGILQSCCSVAQSCLTLCDPMDCSTSGLSDPHHLPEFAQVHVHCVSDAIQSSHPLMPSTPSALNLSQHQGLQ